MDWNLFFTTLLAFFVLQLVANLFRRGSGDMEARLARLERKIDLIMQALNIQDTPPQASHRPIVSSAASMNEVQQLLIAGNKIQAIKLYREMTGLGLKEAKDAVDTMQRDLGL